MGSLIPVWTRALRQERLDLSFSSSGAHVTRIMERPGLWMDETQRTALARDLTMVAARSLPAGSLNYGVFAGDAEALQRSVITLISDRTTGRPVAFNALAIMDVTLHGTRVDVVHLGLVMVDPEARSQGLSWLLYGFTCILLFVRNQLRPLWISNVTQVPAIVGMVSETFSDVFPRPLAPTRRSFAHLVLARQIMSHHRHVFGVGSDAGFDDTRFVITNAYTGGSDELKKSFEAAPKHRQPDYNAFCASELDYVRGDDLLQIGRMDLEAARRYLAQDVPRESLPGALLALGFVALTRLLLPLIYWFSADRPWGDLRARRP
jgi:hypothetical protein